MLLAKFKQWQLDMGLLFEQGFPLMEVRSAEGQNAMGDQNNIKGRGYLF